MHPAEVLDHQADLASRLMNPLVRRTWVHQLTLDGGGGERATGNAAAMLVSLHESVRQAHAFHVKPDMTTLITYAASQLNDLDRFDYRLAPTRHGIARFERPIPFQDIRSQKMSVSWLVWGPIAMQREPAGGKPDEATCVYMFNDVRDQPDEVSLKVRQDFSGQTEETLGRWGFMGAQPLFDQMRMGPAFLELDEDKRAEVLADGDMPSQFTNILRITHAFWLLLGQTVTSTSEAELSRPTRRRAERMGLPPRVSVIYLRHLASRPAEGETLMQWSHRWVVRGHWRWQVCSEHHDLAQLTPKGWRARIWINPHVKGPEDKPLVVTDKVYALHR